MNKFIHIAYLTQAREFLIIFNVVNDKFSEVTEKTNVKYFLLFHSIELTLKSFLVYKKFTDDFLKNTIGHDLEKALDNCKQKGLESIFKIEAQFEAEVKHMNKYYKSKQFEYPFIGAKVYVEHANFVKPLEDLINKLDFEYRKTFRK